MKTNKYKVKKLGKEYDIELEVEARNVIQDDDHQFLSKDKIKDLESKPGSKDPVTSNTVAFTQAATRVNINTGETLSILFGKIKKYFADLKAVSFTGAYNDLTGLPTLGTAASKGVSNSLSVTQDGYVLDAKAGKTVNDKFGGMHFYEDASGKYVVGADSVPKKLGESEYKTRKLFFSKNGETPWYSGNITGYEKTGDSFTFYLGTGYTEVIAGIVDANAIIYNYENAPDTTKNNISINYNPSNGNIGINYGSGLAGGGGHCAKVIVVYKTN